jgi:nicotinic acid phosphoribosyltransferase
MGARVRSSPRDFVEYLPTVRFTGDVHALPEGTIFFGEEPILRVTAPLPEAQLAETMLVNIVHDQSMIPRDGCGSIPRGSSRRRSCACAGTGLAAS